MRKLGRGPQYEGCEAAVKEHCYQVWKALEWRRGVPVKLGTAVELPGRPRSSLPNQLYKMRRQEQGR